MSTRPQRPRTTQADPVAVVAENRLLGQPAPTHPNQVWVGNSGGALVLPSHVARCLLAARGGLEFGRPNAH